uniref:Salivary protein A n=1 Tax=Phlebotomus orientalis TaxID=99786 RepID=V5K6A8_PHLOR|nr:salivary protein A [Phlebotomus orientalis]
MNFYSGVILSVVTIFSHLVAGNDFNNFNIPYPVLPPDFGAKLSEQINRQVQEGLSGLKDLEQLKDLGPKISHQIQTQVDNQLWFRGPNVCFTETVEDVPPNMFYFGTSGQFSQSCNGINDEYVCSIIETENGHTQRKTKVYKCCQDSSLGYISEKIRCLKNN